MPPALAGRYRLLTLLVDGEVPVTTGWYRGFLPANTHVVTGHGLAWGVNHLQVARPAIVPGRLFVARAAQHLPSVAAVVEHLHGQASAGGFAYTIGARRTGEVAVVETAAGRAAVTTSGPDASLIWHTNHLRWLDPGSHVPSGGVASSAPDPEAVGQLGDEHESRCRGAVLDRLRPTADAGPDWFRRVLAEAPVPHGVRRDAAGADPLLTLCTTIVDLTSEQITLISRGGVSHTIGWDDLVHGRCPAATAPTRTRT